MRNGKDVYGWYQLYYRKTCNVIYGVVTLPNEPTVTGLVGRNAYGCLPCGFTQPASGTPAQ